MKFTPILVLGLITLAGCAGSDSSTETKSNSFSYELEENGCNTGAHSFASQTEMCRALENDSLNNYCAYNLRAEYFKQTCPGQFKSNPSNSNDPAPVPSPKPTPSLTEGPYSDLNDRAPYVAECRIRRESSSKFKLFSGTNFVDSYYSLTLATTSLKKLIDNNLCKLFEPRPDCSIALDMNSSNTLLFIGKHMLDSNYSYNNVIENLNNLKLSGVCKTFYGDYCQVENINGQFYAKISNTIIAKSYSLDSLIENYIKPARLAGLCL